MATTKASSKKVTTPEMPEVTGYETEITLFATRYKQGGRTVYGLHLSPEQVVNFIPMPNPEEPNPGNRKVRPKHAEDFSRYFREQGEWAVPGLTLRIAEPFKFDPLYEAGGSQFGTISFPLGYARNIHIIDGQHRIYGFHVASRTMATELDKAQSARATARRNGDHTAAAMAEDRIKAIDAQRQRFQSDRISVEVVVEADIKKAQQLFVDFADNALGTTAGVRVRFDQRKIVNRALEQVLTHPLLANRVDQERDHVGRGSPYIMGAKHVAEIIRTANVGLEGRVSRRQEVELKEADVANRANNFFDLLVKVFPQFQAIQHGQIMADDLRKSSMLGSVLFVRILAGVQFELLENHGFSNDMVEEFFSKLGPHLTAPVYEESIWVKEMPIPVFAVGGSAPNGRRQDTKTLRDTIVDWAIEKPKFLDEPPAPRPIEPEFALEDPSEAEAGDILRPEIAKARNLKAVK